MNKIAIVTDSTADLPLEIIKSCNISVVPLKVNFQDRSYTEGLDLTNKEFYEKLEKADVLPTTSQPSPADFIKKYEELIALGYDSIISIHISDKLSGTRQSALIAGKEIGDRLKNFIAIDSKQVTIGFGIIVKMASEYSSGDMEFKDVVNKIQDAIERCELFALVDTLKFLEKGGRIGKAKAILGSLLNIKPILTTVNGEIVDKDKARTRKKGVQMLVELAAEHKNINSDKEEKVRVAISHSQIIEEAEKLKERINEELGLEVDFIADVGSVVGTHIGPGALFIAIV